MALLHSLSTSIHKAMYIQTSDPGAVGAKVMWTDITSLPYSIKRRNDANSGWDTLGFLPSDAAVASGSIATALDFKNSVRATTSGNAYANNIGFHPRTSGSNGWGIDDMYCNNDSGSSPENTFLGSRL